MKKIFIYLDETYNLQNKNQFYCFAGFITSESENVKIEYKRILHKLKLLSKTSNKEIKSTDKEAKRIREKLLKNEKILLEIELIGIYQLKDRMNFKYFRDLTIINTFTLIHKPIRLDFDQKKRDCDYIELYFQWK